MKRRKSEENAKFRKKVRERERREKEKIRRN